MSNRRSATLPKIVSIQTERLSLGPLMGSDAPILAAYRHDPEVARYQSWESYSLQESKDLIATMSRSDPWGLNRWYQYAIRLSSDQRLIGDIGLRRRANGPSYDADIGYTLDPAYQRQGYMREALGGLQAWAQHQLLIRRFTASIDPRNLASARLLAALGYQREASFVQSVWFKGAWADDHVYVWQER